MEKQIELKRTQVKGKKYDLPSEEVQIEKLIQKGLGLQAQLSDLKEKMEAVNAQLIKIARERREGQTTIKLKGISGETVITFRETYTCTKDVEMVQQELGSLFDRFFTKKTEYKVEKELKQFLEGEQTYGLNDPDAVKKLLQPFITKSETKPNVKLTGAG